MTNASVKNTFSVLFVCALAVTFSLGVFATIANAQDVPDDNIGYVDSGSDTALYDTGSGYTPDTALYDTGSGYTPDTALYDTGSGYTPDNYVADCGCYSEDIGGVQYTNQGSSYSPGYSPSYSQGYSQPSFSFSAPQTYYQQPVQQQRPATTYAAPVQQQQQQQQQQQIVQPVAQTQPINIVNTNNNNNVNTNTVTPSVSTVVPIYQSAVQYPVQYVYPQNYNYGYNYQTYAPAPSCTITLSNSGYYNGYNSGSATLTWYTSGNATSAYISPNIGNVALSGSMSVYTTGGIYTMGVSGPGGTNTCQTTYSYVATPSVSLSQIPYTGFDFGPIGNAMYYLSLLAFAAAGAYLLVYYSGSAMSFATSGIGNRSNQPVRQSIVKAPAAAAPVSAQRIAKAVKPVADLSNLPVFAAPVAQKSVAERGMTTKDSMALTHSKDGSAPRITISRA